jgi:uncharacterized membrane protein YfcA
MAILMVAKIAAAYGLLAGVLSATATALLSISFAHDLIIAAVTGLLAAIGAVAGAALAARITARALQPHEQKLDDVAAIVGAKRRRTDREP